jgi:hypothetical protein
LRGVLQRSANPSGGLHVAGGLPPAWGSPDVVLHPCAGRGPTFLGVFQRVVPLPVWATGARRPLS